MTDKNNAAEAPAPAISEPDDEVAAMGLGKPIPESRLKYLAECSAASKAAEVATAISEEEVARKYVHLAFNPPVPHGSVIDWEKVILAAIREFSRRQREQLDIQRESQQAMIESNNNNYMRAEVYKCQLESMQRDMAWWKRQFNKMVQLLQRQHRQKGS